MRSHVCWFLIVCFPYMLIWMKLHLVWNGNWHNNYCSFFSCIAPSIGLVCGYESFQPYVHECIVHLLMQATINFCRFNEFGDDGGPAARQLKPKFSVFSKHVATQTGFEIPHIEVRKAFKSFSSLPSQFTFLFHTHHIYVLA